MSDFQRLPQGRVIRRGKRVNRSERLHLKLDPQVVSNFKAALSGSGFTFSETLRFYFLRPQLLFSRPKKFRNRDSFDPRDFYQTPYPMTEALAGLLKSQNVPQGTQILDPCVGHGAILDVLREAFPQAWGFDKYVEYESPKQDFLTFNGDVEMIVTNPPFNLATEFIEHAMTVTKTAWFLLPLDYLCSRGRYERVYHNPNFHCSTIRVFSRSPTMKQEKVKTMSDSESGKMSYAWYCFARGSGESTMGHFFL